MSETQKKPEKPNLDGYRDVPTSVRRVDFWARPGEDQWLTGELLGRRERLGLNGQPEGLLILRLDQWSDSMQLQVADKETPDRLPAKGNLVGVNQSAGLVNLTRAADSDRKVKVFIEWLDKSEIGKGRSFWNMNVKASVMVDEKREDFEASGFMDEVPF